MERRIKIIWLLSLASMLLIGAGQGYWLWSHYHYTNEEYGHEVLRQVSEAAKAYNELRWQEPRHMGEQKEVKWYNTNVNWEEQTDSLTRQESTRIYLVQRMGAEPADTVPGGKQPQSGKTGVDLSGLPADSTVLCTDSVTLHGSKTLYERLNMMYLADLMRLEVTHPFRLRQFDSVLTATLPGVPFVTRLATTAADSVYLWEPTLRHNHSLLRPTAHVVYPYNPLKRQLVEIDLRIPRHVLLLRMGGQLAGSLLMIAVLGVCLLFQIKTILKQRRVDELRRSFVNTMIHELKRPVQTLKMCLAYLGDPALRNDRPTTDKVVGDSIAEVDNLSAYLSKLRDMTRADDRRTPLCIRTFDLYPVVEKLVRMQHIPDHKSVTFETRLDRPLEVRADPMHLANILGNLLENAVKYSGPSVRIAVGCTLADHRLTLTVADNGIGIPLHEQTRVFDKFYRSASLPDRSVPGIGLGLSYVKLLVEAHQGTVGLRSRPGQGTTVTVSIPQ